MTEPGLHARLHWQRNGRRFSFEANLPGRGVSALFGPSGAGKSSCLRAIAGLDPDCRGQLVFAGQTWQDEERGLWVPTHRRGLGYVMQEAGLFPHLSVAGNLDFGRRRARGGVLQRDALVESFGLAGLLRRRPASLSGGERQRVAIARALLSDPALLLLDEPLSALDSAARSSLLATLEQLRAHLAVPMLYVSHSIEEVARLADHLMLIEDGRIIAAGSLQDTLSRTDLPPALADALGTVIEGHISAHEDDQLSRFAFRGGHLLLPRRPVAAGTPMRCRIAARDVAVALRAATDSSVLNQLPATVLSIAATADPSQCLVQLQAGGQRLLARISQRSRHALALAPGMTVHAQIKATAL